MNISHLKIGTRLGLAFGLLIVMMLGIALIGVLRLGKVGEINTRLIEDDWVRAEAASVIDTTTRSNARRTMELVIASDAEHQKLVKAAIGTNKKTIDDAIAVLDQRVYLPEAKAVLLRLKDLRGKYVQSFSKVVQMVEAGDREGATALLKSETLPALDALQEPINAMNALEKKLVETGGRTVVRDIASARIQMLALGAAGLLIGVALAYWITRSIIMPLRRAVPWRWPRTWRPVIWAAASRCTAEACPTKFLAISTWVIWPSCRSSGACRRRRSPTYSTRSR